MPPVSTAAASKHSSSSYDLNMLRLLPFLMYRLSKSSQLTWKLQSGDLATLLPSASGVTGEPSRELWVLRDTGHVCTMVQQSVTGIRPTLTCSGMTVWTGGTRSFWRLVQYACLIQVSLAYESEWGENAMNGLPALTTLSCSQHSKWAPWTQETDKGWKQTWIACGHFQHPLNSTSVSMATFVFVLSVLMVSISTYKANIFKTKYLWLTPGESMRLCSDTAHPFQEAKAQRIKFHTFSLPL